MQHRQNKSFLVVKHLPTAAHHPNRPGGGCTSSSAADRDLLDLRCRDREIQRGLDDLRVQMTRHWRAGTPWRARDAMDVIMILDMPAWAALLGLIDECPVIHAAMGASLGSPVRAVSASSFEFISANRQIASVREFMQSLPETLRA